MNLNEFDGPQIVAIIIGLTEVAKKFKVPPKWCLITAIVVGVAMQLLIEAAFQYPAMGPWIAAVLKGLIYGLSATGLYAVGSRWVKKRPDKLTKF